MVLSLELRERIVRLFQKGKKQEVIADLLDVPQSTVSYWIVRFKKTGGVQTKSKSGRPNRLTQAQLAVLREDLQGFPPSRYGGESMGWITKMALDYIRQKFGVSYGMRAVQKLLHEAGLRLITPRPEHVKGSKLARQVFMDEFKKKSRRNIWIAPSLISTK